LSENKEPTPSWLFKQSAVIPYRKKSGVLEILMITTRKSKRWIVPKGVVDPGCTPQESAINEAYEEAGIKGKIVSDVLGSYSYDKWGGTCTVKVFLFKVDKVLDKWPESEERKREWLPVKKAIERIRENKLKKIIQKTMKSL